MNFEDFFQNEWVLGGKSFLIEEENITDLQFALKSVK